MKMIEKRIYEITANYDKVVVQVDTESEYEFLVELQDFFNKTEHCIDVLVKASKELEDKGFPFECGYCGRIVAKEKAGTSNCSFCDES
ncbi:hypothetical protein [Bacillus toyonensis]|uniref:hypothetical protein n=1 Tax=Bacillus toyonensis TaxID=155322 RepID=UPI001C0CD874|nr:hypothetical protein [Bacillus toyonensis]MBU4643154.1 hypothetical protein [Bacillus toyonensis]